MLAAAAASGPLAMVHLVGITPEARTRAEAFGPNHPERTITVTEETLKTTRDEMCTVKSAKIDLVALGCPHYSIAEIQNVLKLLAGRKVAANTEFWIYTTKQVRDLAERMGIMAELLALGGKIATETCMLISPVETWGFKTLMTDSGKCSYYAPMQCKTDVIFGSTAECVEAAVNGRVREGSVKTFKGKGVTDGKNAGPALVTRQMFGFWGGVDPATGNIIDQRHELCGQNIKGKVFVFPEGRARPWGRRSFWSWRAAAMLRRRLSTITRKAYSPPAEFWPASFTTRNCPSSMALRWIRSPRSRPETGWK